MKKAIKYSTRAFAILLGAIILIYTVAYIYVASNRQQIIKQVTSEISERLEGTIAIGNVDISFFSNFPQVSVLFSDVSIHDSLYSQHQHGFFEAKKMFGHISLVNLVLGKEPMNGLRIDDGKMYVFTDTSGYTNSYLFTPRKNLRDTTPKPKKDGNGLQTIRLKDFRFTVDNRVKEKLYDIEVLSAFADINTTDSLIEFEIEKESIIHSLAFNLKKGSFVKGASFESEFDLVFNKKLRQLSFNDMDVELKGHPFVFAGEFNFAGNRNYRFSVATKNIDHEFAKSILTKKIATAISVVRPEKTLDVQAVISGVLAPGEPLVDVKFKTKNNNIQSDFFNVSNATFSGGYTNEVVKGVARNDANSMLYTNDFTAKWEGIDVKSKKAVITNLTHPVIACDLQSKFELTALNNLLESKSFKLKKGKGSIDITYSGPMIENSNRNTFINGSFSFANSSIEYVPRKMTMNDCSGNIVFKNSDVFVNNFRSVVNNNKLLMNGSAKNLLSLIKNNPGKIALDWDVYSPAINLESFKSLLEKRNKVVTVSVSEGKLRKTAKQIDEMLNEASIKLQVKADKIGFKRFDASNVHAAIDMENEDWNLKDVSFNHANGRMKLTGKLKEQDSKLYAAAANIEMENVDVEKVFYAFNNFEQDGIKSENIRGKLSTNVVISMNLDRQLSNNPTNMEGYIDFSLKKGALLDFEPMQKLQNFLFKNRNFEQIFFAELKNRIEIKDKEFIINRMEIQSTALTLFVNGVYSMEGKTDLSIQVPISNLKKRGENYKPENIGADAKAGPSVFVRGQPGEDGSIKFKLDIFNKIRKRFKDDGD